MEPRKYSLGKNAALTNKVDFILLQFFIKPRVAVDGYFTQRYKLH